MQVSAPIDSDAINRPDANAPPSRAAISWSAGKDSALGGIWRAVAVPDGVCPCGEDGEFHTFVHAMPGMAPLVPTELVFEQLQLA